MKYAKFSRSLLPLAFILLSAFCIRLDKQHTVWLIGDSTIANKETKAYPETGWGMPFSVFFDSTIKVDNRAKNGRSTKSFIKEGLWQQALDNMQEGDYVFIQFGHNDESKDKGDRYSTPDEFKANLVRYVNESKARNAIPVLVTPVSRRKFDKEGKLVDTHAEYAPLVKQVADSLGTLFIDLNAKSMELIRSFGPENSKWLFNHLTAGEHPNYPEGKQDDTHFNELGARKIAEIMLAEIKDKIPALYEHIRKVPAKK